MKTRMCIQLVAVLCGGLFTIGSSGQWTAAPHPLLTAGNSGATVGVLGAGPSAFNVFGQQMTPPTTEVFRTDAPLLNNNPTYWRMFHGGIEYGNLFHLDRLGAGGHGAVENPLMTGEQKRSPAFGDRTAIVVSLFYT